MLEGTGHECRRRVYSIEGIAPTLLAGMGTAGNNEPKILVK